MFSINYRLVLDGQRDRLINGSRTQLEDEVLGGFFEVVCNEKKYGLFSAEPLWEGETGQFIIDVWIRQLLKATVHLETASYCAVLDIETQAKWLEIKRDGEFLVISLAHCEFGGHQFVEYRPLPNPLYPDWKNERVLFAQFKDEVRKKSKTLLRELEEINPELLKVSGINEIAELAAKL
jgi:hypothetical protein